MIFGVRQLAAAFSIAFSVSFAGPLPDARAADSTADLVRKGHARLSEWDLPEAQAILDAIRKGNAGDPNVQFLEAVVEFHKGNHAEAKRHIDALSMGAGGGGGAADLIRASAGATEGYVEEKSAGGHFRIRYPPGPSAILAPLALEALEKSRAAVGAALDYLPPEEITVEVLKDGAALAAMTGLSESEIEATGTIAVCKYNRIMFISPEALATGYPWLDTLGHEYTHYVTGRKTADGVEVWLHEVMSKMHESAWRGRAAALRPDHEGIIAQALREGKLVTFARMSPSMAKLPDQHAASLAFAEVFSAGVFFSEKGGPGVFARMLSAVAAGGGMPGAIRAAGFSSMDDFEAQWRVWLKGRYAGKALVERQFYRAKFKKGKTGRPDAQEDAGGPSARTFLRLGDLLLARGHHAAAAEEFGKAARASERGTQNPVIQNRLAVALLQSGKPAEAAAALDGVKDTFPDYISTHMNLARIHMRSDKPELAEAALRSAAEINPFDPEIWGGLAAIYKTKGDRKAYEQAAKNLKLLKGND
ncbi:MAG: tetratricopeptide repeat protein [Deltaproteobacteria bacterium]|nr:tetratricopeptide repeat protein [Deltaproteobacteria bacterium]